MIFLFSFWENVFLTSYVGCYLIYSCRKTFKQPFTDVFQNFAIFTGKHLCWSLFLITLQELRPAFLLKRDSNTGEIFTFSCEHFKTFKNSFFIEHLFTVFFRNFMWWYILDIIELYFTHQKATWEHSQTKMWWKNAIDANDRINTTNVD